MNKGTATRVAAPSLVFMKEISGLAILSDYNFLSVRSVSCFNRDDVNAFH